MTPPRKLLVVDDDLGAIRTMSRILAPLGDVQFATNGADAMRLVADAPPALILLDAEMPGMSGFQMCELLKADSAFADIPVIFVTSHSEPAFEVAGLEIGAVDFIAKPVSPPLLEARVKTQLRIKALADEVKRMSTVDALTELLNRRSFDAALQREWRRSLRSNEPVSLILVDVDHFRAYNERYGRPAGDRCLQAVAKALRRGCMRPADVVARYGGEEFALLLPATPRAGAGHVATRILAEVESLLLPHDASPTSRHVTVSIGLSSHDEDTPGWIGTPADSRFVEDEAPPRVTHEALLRAADQALAAAKRAGRAQACMLDPAFADDAAAVRDVLPAGGVEPFFAASV